MTFDDVRQDIKALLDTKLYDEQEVLYSIIYSCVIAKEKLARELQPIDNVMSKVNG